MRPVSYSRASDVGAAIGAVSSDPESAFLAGGTTQVDLLRIYVEQPRRLVDINDLPLNRVEALPDGGLRIGGLARMSDVAQEPELVRRYPMVAESLLLGASPQLRNMATIGGNLLQRVRCSYFRDTEAACNKRVPGSGCSALEGINRGHAVLGTSDQCIATHPSDLAVALVALDAVVQTEGPGGARSIPIDDFFLLPGQTPEREHPLTHGELVTGIDLPPAPVAATSRYIKIRDRESYEFALASVAVAIAVDDGRVTEVRLALGGVATKPWRARAAERELNGAPATTDSFTRAAAAELAPAVSHGMNDFKVELARRTVVRALEQMTQREGPA
ncbi:FAD binding domain-containing protein [Micromonospora parathelypteridis]|uniref:Xanthine dehydrogenase YagS FAD-binding subunit n=1 Tax=Micromonospora parathelypteridis TaxID=1839617 RepID=A0A840VQU1_9ACTN|nr:xanthine dehydrogenase family protein subunit M [Micromonospora parathelypteridis]MBB5476384.1 xanthine dehydrogenase YagS FAD-binding subunit [Micromonospora parathelypteridis]GGO14894.1 carbon-monoxide dehydrogenase medium subunit [Micromonospora parathelypteridis]